MAVGTISAFSAAFGTIGAFQHREPNHLWCYDLVGAPNGTQFRMPNIIDEFTREDLTIRIGRKLNSTRSTSCRTCSSSVRRMGEKRDEMSEAQWTRIAFLLPGKG